MVIKILGNSETSAYQAVQSYIKSKGIKYGKVAPINVI